MKEGEKGGEYDETAQRPGLRGKGESIFPTGGGKKMKDFHSFDGNGVVCPKVESSAHLSTPTSTQGKTKQPWASHVPPLGNPGALSGFKVRRISIEDAATAFLRDYARGHARNSVLMVKTHVLKFKRECKRKYLDELLKYDLTSFLSQWEDRPRHFRASALRVFLRWCAARYKLLLPLPDSTCVDLPPATYESLSEEATRVKTMAKRAFARLEMPHQKLLFYCGYLYCLPLSWLLRAKFPDLLALQPQIPVFYNVLAETKRVAASADAPFFRAWLGKSLQTARGRWKEWAECTFSEIVEAGNLARWKTGQLPQIGKHKAQRYMWLLPTIDAVGLERILGLLDKEGKRV